MVSSSYYTNSSRVWLIEYEDRFIDLTVVRFVSREKCPFRLIVYSIISQIILYCDAQNVNIQYLNCLINETLA